jgi:hypothetical protein
MRRHAHTTAILVETETVHNTVREEEVVERYRIISEREGSRTSIHERTFEDAHQSQRAVWDVFAFGYFLSPFGNAALIVAGEHSAIPSLGIVVEFILLGYETVSDWIDLGRISIPPEWSYTITEFGPTTSIDIFGEGASGPIHMAVWDIMVGNPHMIINAFSSRQAFSFDNGRGGYMLKNHVSGDHHTLALWLENDPWIALSLYYDGDDSVFTENEELILQIARTLTLR